MAEQAIAYYRVSTQEQGANGHGLGAQRHTVREVAARHGFELAGEFTEVESGTRKARHRRTQLTAAVEECQRTGARLLFAKLDRFARDVELLAWLINSGVRWMACDMPEINETTAYILMAVAEMEAKDISRRTREGLAEARRKGVRLGNPDNLTEEAQRKGAAAVRQAAIDFYADVYDYIALLRERGAEDGGMLGYAAIAKILNERGRRTQRGGKFYPATVRRILERGNGDAEN